MLAYLDALLAALAARDILEIDRLLAHPLVRILPREVLADAAAERRAAAIGTAPGAPLRLLRLRHLTAQLLDGRPAPAAAQDTARPRRARPAPALSDRRLAALQQMELSLFS